MCSRRRRYVHTWARITGKARSVVYAIENKNKKRSRKVSVLCIAPPVSVISAFSLNVKRGKKYRNSFLDEAVFHAVFRTVYIEKQQ